MVHFGQNCVLFTFPALLMTLKEGANGIGKLKNQLTYKHVTSSGEILN